MYKGITGIAELACVTNALFTDTYALPFKTAKDFVSWLRLAPNNRISGGKILSSRTPKGKNKFALTLRNVANSIDRKKEGHLMLFFKRIEFAPRYN